MAYNNCILSQGFAENENNSYASAGLKGHTGEDYVCGYGKPLSVVKRIYVYKIIDGVKIKSNDGSGFTGVFGVDEDGFEWLYGHLNPSAEVGRWYEKGEVIGTEANHGTVYSKGELITLEMQAAGDTRGSHLHLQVRACEKTKDPGNRICLHNADGSLLKVDDCVFAVKNYSNGFNGCVPVSEASTSTAPPPQAPPIYASGLSLSEEYALIAARRQANGESDVAFAWSMSKLVKAFGK